LGGGGKSPPRDVWIKHCLPCPGLDRHIGFGSFALLLSVRLCAGRPVCPTADAIDVNLCLTVFRYRIVIHGGIDGFSRMFVFLKASDNNRRETVLKSFVSACSTFGLPSRIRVDNGGENSDVCDVMQILRGCQRGSAIRGRSVHNQRIERAWVDVWNGVTNVYVDAFNS